MLFEEVIEMGSFIKTQCVSNFRYGPRTMLQQDFRFLQYTFGNDLGSSFLRGILNRPVQVVYMYI